MMYVRTVQVAFLLGTELLDLRDTTRMQSVVECKRKSGEQQHQRHALILEAPHPERGH